MYAYHPTEDPMIEVTGRPMETLPVQEFLSDPKTYLDEVQFRNGGYLLTGRDGFGDVGYLLADFPLTDSMASTASKVDRNNVTWGVNSTEGADA